MTDSELALERARATATRLEQELAECRRLLEACTTAVFEDDMYDARDAARAWLHNTPDGPPLVGDLIESVIAHGHHEDCVTWGGESYPGPCNCPVALAAALADVPGREEYYGEAGTR